MSEPIFSVLTGKNNCTNNSDCCNCTTGEIYNNFKINGDSTGFVVQRTGDCSFNEPGSSYECITVINWTGPCSQMPGTSCGEDEYCRNINIITSDDVYAINGWSMYCGAGTCCNGTTCC